MTRWRVFALKSLKFREKTFKIVDNLTEIDRSVKKITVLTVWEAYSVDRLFSVIHSQPLIQELRFTYFFFQFLFTRGLGSGDSAVGFGDVGGESLPSREDVAGEPSAPPPPPPPLRPTQSNKEAELGEVRRWDPVERVEKIRRICDYKVRARKINRKMKSKNDWN